MKISLETTIDKPRHRVVELLLNPKTLGMIEPNILSSDSVNGKDLGETGAEYLRIYSMPNGGKYQVLQTMVEVDKPNLIVTSYESEHYSALARSRFEPSGPGQTSWKLDVDMRFRALIPRLLPFLVKGSVQSQNIKNMATFKAFAESPQSQTL